MPVIGIKSKSTSSFKQRLQKLRKPQNEKGVVPIVIVIILAVVVAGLGYGAYRSFSQKTASLPTTLPIKSSANPPSATEEPAASPEEPLETNFSETGNILNWDSQTESYTEDWTLLYEKPGHPAISVKLVFNEASLCDLGEGMKNCDKNQLNNGDRAMVEGNRNNDQVTVIKLTEL